MSIKIMSDGPVTPGLAAPASNLIGLIVSTVSTVPAIAIAGQQMAVQGDVIGNLRVSPYGHPNSLTTIESSTGSAGNEVTLTVPAATKWIVKSSYIKLVASASAGNRQVGLFTEDPSGNVNAAIYSTILQTATQTGQYTFAPSVTTSTAFANTAATVGFPELWLGPGATINTAVAGLLSGDVVTLTLMVLVLPA